MMQGSEEQAEPRRPEPPWLAAAMIGLTISILASGAIMLGAGMAIGQALTRCKLDLRQHPSRLNAGGCPRAGSRRCRR